MTSISINHGDISAYIIFCIELAVFTLGILHFITKFKERYGSLFLVIRTFDSRAGLKNLIRATSKKELSDAKILLFFVSAKYADNAEKFLAPVLILWALAGFLVLFYDFGHYGQLLTNYEAPLSGIWLDFFQSFIIFFIYFTLLGIPTLFAFSWWLVRVVYFSWPRDSGPLQGG